MKQSFNPKPALSETACLRLRHSDSKNNSKKDKALHKDLLRKSAALQRLTTYGYMNIDSNPLSFAEVRRLARDLQIPDFKVLELKQYKRLAKNHTEPANCIIYIPWKDQPNRGHYVSCFRERDGSLNYQDSFGNFNDFPMKDVNRVFHINKVKYQSVFANNCGYLALLHLYTHDELDPSVKKL